MRIALVTTSFLPHVGGAELVVHHLAKAWQEGGHEVKVFYECNDEEGVAAEPGYATEGYAVMRGTYRMSPHRFPFRQVNRGTLRVKLETWRPDIISAHFGYPVGVWLSDIPQLASRTLVTCHGKDLTASEWGYRSRYGCDQVLASSLNRFPHVVAISAYARQQLEAIGVDATRIRDIPNGVEIERFGAAPTVDIRERFSVPADSPLVLSVGRNVPEKAYHMALKVIGEVMSRHRNACYLAVGRGVESLDLSGLPEDSARRVVRCPGLFGEELVSAYRQADIFFSASASELFPLTVLEAMAAGLPLVLTDISGHSDVLKGAENGFLFAPEDCSAGATALLRLLENASLRRDMGKSSVDKAREYSWQRVSESYLTCFNVQPSATEATQ